MIRLVTDQDFKSWLKLAKQVEFLFGKMVGCEHFEKGIKECISNSQAFCSIDSNNITRGIIAIDKQKNEIIWMAVDRKHSGKGYGQKLLKTALKSLDRNKPIFVQTFSADVKEGHAARKLYMKFGFKDYKRGMKNPAEIETTIMRLEERLHGNLASKTSL